MSAYSHPANRAINISIWLMVGIAIGIATIWTFRGLNTPRTEARPQFAESTPGATGPGKTAAYVLLEVDALTNTPPNVEAVWLAVLASDQATAELIGLPPEPFNGKYSPETGLPLTALEPYLHGTFAGALVFDHEAITEFVNRLGGVWLMGKQVSGAELLNFVDAADQKQSGDVLTRQAAALQGVLAQLAMAGTRVNYVSLFDCANLMSVDRDVLLGLLGQYYPVKTDNIRVHLADSQ